MKRLSFILIVTVAVCCTTGYAKSVTDPPPPPPGTADKLEGFPWIAKSKVKIKYGPGLPLPTTQDGTTSAPPSSTEQPTLTIDMVQAYLAALTKVVMDRLQPLFLAAAAATANSTPPPPPFYPGSKKALKGKVPKRQINAEDLPMMAATTEAFLAEERRLYPDSFYDEFYMDWLKKKRQVGFAGGEIPVATPSPLVQDESSEESNSPVIPQLPSAAVPNYPPTAIPPPPYPPMNPYLSPYFYPLAGMKLSKAVAQAQVNAALAAWNITTTAKPVKIKLKIPIPAGSDLASVVASGIAGFPTGTTYELSRKKK